MKLAYLVLSIRDINRLLKNAKSDRAKHKKTGTNHCIVVRDIPINPDYNGRGVYFQINSAAVINPKNIIG